MAMHIISQDSNVDIVSHKTVLKGNFTFGDTVKIDGRIEGEISTIENDPNSVLIVGQNAFINAEISCDTIVIEGLVKGNIVSRDTLEIRNTGILLGNVTAQNIIIHPGGVLEGSCKIATS